MHYPGTDIACSGGCDLGSLPSASLQQCAAACNATAGCAALVYLAAGSNCTLKGAAGPGAPRAGADAYVRVLDAVAWDFTATYNAAPPVCPGEPNWVCPRYANSWWPNATPAGARSGGGSARSDAADAAATAAHRAACQVSAGHGGSAASEASRGPTSTPLEV